MRRSEGTPSGKGAKKNCSAAVQRRVLPCAASRCALTSHALEDAIPTPRTELHRGPCGCALRSCAQQQNAKRRPSNSEHTTPPRFVSAMRARAQGLAAAAFPFKRALRPVSHGQGAKRSATPRWGATAHFFKLHMLRPSAAPPLSPSACRPRHVPWHGRRRRHGTRSPSAPARRRRAAAPRSPPPSRARAPKSLKQPAAFGAPLPPAPYEAGWARERGGGPVWDKGVGLRCLLPARREGPRQVSSNDTERGSRTSLFIRCVTLDAVAP